MATFGRFEAVREIHRTGYTTVYTGRSPESTADNFVIKVFQPPSLLLEGGQAKAEIELFLKSTETQQKTSAGDAQHWAPVHQHGQITEGAFYVTEKYEHSLQQLIDIRLKLSSKVLGTILESVAKGLMELKESCGRPHGNLKATNVLMSGTEDISQGKIVLCDPLPDELIDTEVHWDSDLRAVAEFIYQLVVHRQSPRVDGWQAPDSKEWRSLGRNAASWRDLYNRLLSAAAKPGTITIETVIEELAQLKTEKQFFSPLRLVAAVLAVIVCTVTLIVFWPSPPAKQEEWKLLCKEYVDWVEPLYGRLKSRNNNEIAARWSNDGDLKKIVEKIREHASYPNKKAIGYGSVIDIIDKDPKILRAEDKETKNALAAIQDIKYFFDPNSADDPNAYSPWPLLVEIHKTANDFKERGWEKAATYLAFLVSSVRPEPNMPIAENVDKILNLKKENTLDEIKTSRNQITKYQKIVNDINEPILSKFDDEFVKREITSTTGMGDEDSLKRLQNKLEEIEVLGQKLAEIIEDDWHIKVNQKEFLRDYNELFPNIQTPTVLTYNRWLDVVRDYYKLDPDPREEIVEPLADLRKNIETAKGFQPEKANILGEELKQEEKNINSIQQIPGITMHKDEIRKKTDVCLFTLKTINKNTLALIVDPIKWWGDIEKITEITKSNAINREWNRRRNLELSKHKKSSFENKKNMDIFIPLMNRIDQTRYRLENLNTKLVPNITTTLKQTDWNTQLGNLYQNRREILLGRIIKETDQLEDTPDPNSLDFKNKWTETLSNLNNWQNTLGQLITAFNTIQERLDICYLLDDKPTQQDSSIRSLWEEWKDTNILKEPEINTILTKVTQRIEMLLKIELSEDGLQLADIATNSNTNTEAVLAAWTRLGSLPAPLWPNDFEDVHKDRAIRTTLKTEFETIRQSNEGRGSLLLKTLTDTGIDREAAFIKKKSAGDKILTKFDETAAKEKGSAALAELEKLEGLAEKITDFVSNPDWPQEFRLDLLVVDLRADDQSPLYNKPTLTAGDFDTWLREVVLYKKLEQDPRTAYTWEEKITGITKLIVDELGTSEEDSSKESSTKPDGIPLFGKITEMTRSIENVLGGKQSDSSKEKIANLKLSYDQFKVSVVEVNNLLVIPAIEKYKDDINADKCKVLWDKLQAHEDKIRSIIKPEYCKRLELMEGKVQRLVFTKTTALSANFEPVNISQLQSSTDKKTPLAALTKFVKGSAESIMLLSKLGELLNKTVEVTGWDEIRQAIDDKQIKWLEFFHTIDLTKTQNVGWPKFIISKKDPSVVLRFIPASTDNPEPYYMAIHETTNEQYRTYLEESGAINYTTEPGWSWFKNQKGSHLIICGTDPPCDIKWEKDTFMVDPAKSDAPATYVTYDGAESYALWHGAELPTVGQHKYACATGTSNIHPWGNDSSQIPIYAHVRGKPWLDARANYNLNFNRLNPSPPPPPLGIVRPDSFRPYESQISDANTVHQKNTDGQVSSWLPIKNATQYNGWGLYDMIGNVWEWCKDTNNDTITIICGGSCLAPPDYITDPSNYSIEFDKKDSKKTGCDVGFRIIVPAR